MNILLNKKFRDLKPYKTKEILLETVRGFEIDVQSSNKAETFYKCLCPFHKEKKPSMKFFFNKHRNGWWFKCFGCGESGDVFKFVRLKKGCQFWTAMLYIIKNYPNVEKKTYNPNQLEIFSY